MKVSDLKLVVGYSQWNANMESWIRQGKMHSLILKLLYIGAVVETKPKRYDRNRCLRWLCKDVEVETFNPHQILNFESFSIFSGCHLCWWTWGYLKRTFKHLRWKVGTGHWTLEFSCLYQTSFNYPLLCCCSNDNVVTTSNPQKIPTSNGKTPSFVCEQEMSQ